VSRQLLQVGPRRPATTDLQATGCQADKVREQRREGCLLAQTGPTNRGVRQMDSAQAWTALAIEEMHFVVPHPQDHVEDSR
jgi:hypothetical protein